MKGFVFLRFVKWFLGLSLVASTAYLISEVVNSKYVPVVPNAALPVELQEVEVQFGLPQLDTNYLRCIIAPSKEFCLLTRDMTLIQIKSKSRDIKSNLARKGLPDSRRRHPLYLLIGDFLELMAGFGVEPCLIEPSMLFCMLNNEEKAMLQKRRFNMSSLMGSANVVSFAVNTTDNEKLEKLASDHNKYGFDHFASRESAPKWLNQSEVFTTHHFFVRRLLVVHVLVFFKKQSYLWHGALDQVPLQLSQVIFKQDLLFASHDSVYENFSSVPLQNNDPNLKAVVRIPSETAYFLLEIQSSRFLECSGSASSPNLTSSDRRHKGRLQKAFFQFQKDVGEVLKSFMMVSFIFGGTLLGWYRECDIIPYTSDIDFAAWAADIPEDESLRKTIAAWPCNIQVLGVPEEAYEYAFFCFEERVDLFFVYQTNDSYWASGHRPSQRYYFRYNYPKFDLCSGDLLGRLVHVPCHPEDVLVAEYGPDWRTPVREWNYEVSPKNRGKRIYWPSNKKDTFTILNGKNL